MCKVIGCILLWQFFAISAFTQIAAIGEGDVGLTLNHFVINRTGEHFQSRFPIGTTNFQDPSTMLFKGCRIIQLTDAHQPFFCRVELQLERKSRLAPRFRLGSLDYVNWIEGKSLFKY